GVPRSGARNSDGLPRRFFRNPFDTPSALMACNLWLATVILDRTAWPRTCKVTLAGQSRGIDTETAMTSDNQTRTERLAEQVSNAIIAGEFAPGARLDEQHLAQRFGVSRTPVREALRQLATSGLIDLRPRRGA